MKRKKKIRPTIINGWSIYAHPTCTRQVVSLLNSVEKEITKGGNAWTKKQVTLRLARITEIIFDEIPANPSNPRYRQGKTLGPKYKHWFRDKFYQRYRLFFRFDTKTKTIIYAWVNDNNTLRDASNPKNDPYAIFKKKLDSGKIPDQWRDLLSASDALTGEKFIPDQGDDN